MTKSLSIALGLAIALTIVAPASADPPMTAQEGGEVAAFLANGQGSGRQIIAQERARSRDARLFAPSAVPAVQVVGSAPADGFDLEDATVGGAAVASLALLVAAGIALRGRTRRAASATS